MKSLWYQPILAFIVLNILLSAWWLVFGDIRYDVDIARDFLLIKEIVTIKLPVNPYLLNSTFFR